MQIITNQFQKEIKKHGSDAFPFLVSEERLSKYDTGSFMWHWHPEIEITYVEKGHMSYKVNQDCFHLKTGEVLLGNSNSLHSGYQKDLLDCKYIAITFSPKLIYGFYESSICTKYVEPITRDFSLSAIHFDYSQKWHHSFGIIVQEMIQLDKNRPKFYELEVVMKLQTLWKLILENHSFSAQLSIHDQVEYERIKKIVSYIELNYSNKFMLKDIAAHIHLCESECSRIFKRYMNISLFSFLQEYRIERSIEYLSDKNQSICNIACKVGFADSNYYSKVFTKVKGLSPQKYRKIWLWPNNNLTYKEDL